MKDKLLSFETEKKVVSTEPISDLFTLLTLKAPKIDEKSVEKRKNLNVVVVVDVSGSMQGDKINLVKKTLLFLVSELTKDDQLSIVLFDSEIRILHPLTHCTPENRVILSESIRSISTKGQTNLSGGLITGLDILRKSTLEVNRISSCLLFTDGEANEGLTTPKDILDCLKGKKEHPPIRFFHRSLSVRYQRMREEKKSPNTLFLENSSCTVYSFGFGENHSKISGLGNGVYYFVENEEAISDCFVDCIGGLLSVSMREIEIRISPHGKCAISGIHTAYPLEKREDGTYVIRMKDLRTNEKRDIIIMVSLEGEESEGKVDLVNLELSYLDFSGSRKAVQLTGCCVRKNTNELEKEEEEDFNFRIDEQKNRIFVSKGLERAKTFLDRNSVSEAVGMYKKMMQKVERSHSFKKSSSCSDGKELSISQALMKDLSEQLEKIQEVANAPTTTANKSQSFRFRSRSHRINSYRDSLRRQRSTGSKSFILKARSQSFITKKMMKKKEKFFDQWDTNSSDPTQKKTENPPSVDFDLDILGMKNRKKRVMSLYNHDKQMKERPEMSGFLHYKEENQESEEEEEEDEIVIRPKIRKRKGAVVQKRRNSGNLGVKTKKVGKKFVGPRKKRKKSKSFDDLRLGTGKKKRGRKRPGVANRVPGRRKKTVRVVKRKN